MSLVRSDPVSRELYILGTELKQTNQKPRHVDLHLFFVFVIFCHSVGHSPEDLSPLPFADCNVMTAGYWPFAKYHVSGPGAVDFLDRLVPNRHLEEDSR